MAPTSKCHLASRKRYRPLAQNFSVGFKNIPLSLDCDICHGLEASYIRQPGKYNHRYTLAARSTIKLDQGYAEMEECVAACLPSLLRPHWVQFQEQSQKYRCQWGRRLLTKVSRPSYISGSCSRKGGTVVLLAYLLCFIIISHCFKCCLHYRQLAPGDDNGPP